MVCCNRTSLLGIGRTLTVRDFRLLRYDTPTLSKSILWSGWDASTLASTAILESIIIKSLVSTELESPSETNSETVNSNNYRDLNDH
jgi:hypothetical protein